MSGKIVQYTFQVSDPFQLATFYRDTLGMKVLRHEEIFENSIGCIGEGGVYHNAWSKTVFGYYPERHSFTLEAHFNRTTGIPIKENQLLGITIRSHDVLKRAKYLNVPKSRSKNKHVLMSDLRFFIIDEPKIENKNPIIKITLQSTNLKRTLDYWHCLLGLKIFSKKRRSVVLGYDDKGIKIKFILDEKSFSMMAVLDADANKKLNRFLEIQRRLNEFKVPSIFHEEIAEEEQGHEKEIKEREEPGEYLYEEDPREEYGEIGEEIYEN